VSARDAVRYIKAQGIATTGRLLVQRTPGRATKVSSHQRITASITPDRYATFSNPRNTKNATAVIRIRASDGSSLRRRRGLTTAPSDVRPSSRRGIVCAADPNGYSV
jgi:hypothetical protein